MAHDGPKDINTMWTHGRFALFVLADVPNDVALDVPSAIHILSKFRSSTASSKKPVTALANSSSGSQTPGPMPPETARMLQSPPSHKIGARHSAESLSRMSSRS
jgi:hypothetical protein